jgi:hypothetical protein
MISKDSFEAYEICILSGQVPQERVPDLLEENPDFAAWYKIRMAARWEAGAIRHDNLAA